MDRLYTHPENPPLRSIRRAVQVLEAGGLIIYPTDTVYGLGCDLFNKKAIERIYQLKGFTKKSRLSFICPDLKNIAKYAHVSTPAYKIMRRLLPGPFTFILEATRQVPKMLLEKRSTVGIRVPDNLVCHSLLEEFGHPIISTSAVLPGIEYLNNPDEIADLFQYHVDLLLDSDYCGLEPSTVIDLSGDEPIIIRKGKGYRDDILL
ncbi:MAG: threonylcarbamoyl-AMP synthase [Calditrichaeota bacterium]|nr:MAG: threonylcarbamoyl-AMP synthase [Calditrichota bacterium]